MASCYSSYTYLTVLGMRDYQIIQLSGRLVIITLFKVAGNQN